jgi:predicted phosphodiesterase
VKKKNLRKNWVINTEQACSTKQINGFARICFGETVVIGRGNQLYNDLFHFPKNVASRHVSVTNMKGDLIITPLEIDAGVKIVRFDNLDYREQMQSSRYHSLLKLRRLFGGSIRILPKEKALQLLKQVNSVLQHNPNRRKNYRGTAGGLVELPGKTTSLIVGDLHAQVDNLLKVLTENCLFDCLRLKTATLIILGDAVHSESVDEMENFDNSILIMDLIFQLKLQFPTNFYYLRGNHDSFSPAVSKNGIPQGILLKKRLLELRGHEYLTEMIKFYSLLPIALISEHFVCCHAGPSRKKINRQALINIEDSDKLAEELVTTRLQRPHYPNGYTKADVKNFRKGLNLQKKTAFIVGHTPLDPFGSVWKNVGAIKNHHIIYSAHPEGPTLFIDLDDNLIPISFPAEPLTKLINRLGERPIQPRQTG